MTTPTPDQVARLHVLSALDLERSYNDPTAPRLPSVQDPTEQAKGVRPPGARCLPPKYPAPARNDSPPSSTPTSESGAVNRSTGRATLSPRVRYLSPRGRARWGSDRKADANRAALKVRP